MRSHQENQTEVSRVSYCGTSVLLTFRSLKKYLINKSFAKTKKNTELEDLMATHAHEIDELFYERGLVNLFEQITDEEGRVRFKP